ncbi:MAG: cystathionine gamma-synthase [Actinobacteria bacterium]|nr:cystathionine gamma-synthase [Actinomycetota bacterium]
MGVVEFETRAIHEGQEPDPATGAVTTPIYQTSTYAHEEVGQHKGYVYSRSGNPTRAALEQCLASLESAEHGFAFASGMAATTTVLHLVNPGDRVVCVNDVYGGTYRLFSKVLEPKGYEFTFLPAEEISRNLAPALDERTRLVWVETPTNPLLNVVDIRAAAEATHAVGAVCVVDNTFASPYLQRPLELGADIVVHSTTKYLGGHSDVIGGFAATTDPTIAERLAFLQNSLGTVPGPFDSWLVLRGLKTLAVRMERHCENARRIAEWLESHASVERVRYPGLASHPDHELAREQMSDFGGMLSFELAGSKEDALAVLRSTAIWQLAESLGGVESLIEHPGLMTHASTADSAFPVPENLIRLSVGIESADDLIADLEQALAAVPAAARS